jgi:hypothetical protein
MSELFSCVIHNVKNLILKVKRPFLVQVIIFIFCNKILYGHFELDSNFYFDVQCVVMFGWGGGGTGAGLEAGDIPCRLHCN